GDATAAAERVNASLRPPLRLGRLELHIGASFGIAMGGRRRDADAMLRDADTAMYQAKAGGSGRTALFDAGMRAAVTRRLTLEAEMQRALEHGEFRLVYQPIVTLATGAITGFEALVRWEHPSRGLLLPDEFISIAEETGLIVPLGAWILAKACRQLRAWQRETPMEALTMAVNLSGQQLAQPDLAARVAAVLVETGIPPDSLHLEITESALVADTARARTTLTQLRDLGVAIYLDDFGVEYSSLNYLRRFPIEAIKIDRSFVRDLLANERDTIMVQAIVTLAHGLGMRVTAEGIESCEQKMRLEQLGCDRGQGYFFGKPMDACDAQAVLVREPMTDARR
ncbi:MAG: GGDEF domain-containing phosphodiesterase, partial [Thermomicrobia bacterium]|nr:GGDEF domain-containing phosphodiesterase [Thermomicrobia bacterium]